CIMKIRHFVWRILDTSMENKAVFKQMCNLIGSTPLSKISFSFQGIPYSIYVKHEHYNLTGSVKDRMALHISYNAYKCFDCASAHLYVFISTCYHYSVKTSVNLTAAIRR
ncbi:MAG: pyridoxal-phosphate dependent enzyme, partial [Clostridia bacterium]|nr:pyridoxal-phosphate dependent enzyme [Clostridia bacterium]